MALTEKSVELNLTSEILNYLAKRYNRSFYALGPSMRAEDRLGFDVSVRAPGQALLIQYKRGYQRSGPEIEWRLNRTTQKDQHQKLQQLEKKGLRVFYAFPRFLTALELSSNRYRLLLETFFWRPLSIQPSGGPTGHHEVRWNRATGLWTVRSDDPAPIVDHPTEWFDVFNSYFDGEDGADYDELARVTNGIFLGEQFSEGLDEEHFGPAVADDSMGGLCIVGWTYATPSRPAV